MALNLPSCQLNLQLLAAAACNGHCQQLLLPWPGPSARSCQEVLEVPGLLEECCAVASNGAWRSCKSARRSCALREDSCHAWPCSWILFFSVSSFLLLTAPNSSHCSLLPWGSSSQLVPHVATPPLHPALCSWPSLGPASCCTDTAEQSRGAPGSWSVTLCCVHVARSVQHFFSISLLLPSFSALKCLWCFFFLPWLFFFFWPSMELLELVLSLSALLMKDCKILCSAIRLFSQVMPRSCEGYAQSQ